MLEYDYQALENSPFISKQLIHAVNIFETDYVMTCIDTIPSVENTLKKKHLSTTVLNEFNS